MVYVPGRSAYALTDDDGAYVLADLPEGIYTVEVQAIADAPRLWFGGVVVTPGLETERNLPLCLE
jgi:hypothetical protein